MLSSLMLNFRSVMFSVMSIHMISDPRVQIMYLSKTTIDSCILGWMNIKVNLWMMLFYHYTQIQIFITEHDQMRELLPLEISQCAFSSKKSSSANLLNGLWKLYILGNICLNVTLSPGDMQSVVNIVYRLLKGMEWKYWEVEIATKGFGIQIGKTWIYNRLFSNQNHPYFR